MKLSRRGRAAIAAEEPIVVGWVSDSTPLQRIGEWSIVGVMHGKLTLDDDVPRAFFATATPEVRGGALARIAWSLMHAEKVDEAVCDRFAALWDARVRHVMEAPEDHEELSGFYWFVRSGKFDVTWWLPRLKQTAALHTPSDRERFVLGKDLAAAADVDARDAFDVMKLLLDAQNEASAAAHELSRHAVPIVLAKAISSGDTGLAAEATAYMNMLGESGHLQLADEVQAVLDGTVTQDDVDV